ncbi:MAG: methyltransferase domain-containing protein [Actinomycetota bacterium]
MSDDYTDATYGEAIAGIYDDTYLAPFESDTAAAVPFLRNLAGNGPALELGIGTGRVALPLAEAGVTVHGIDVSEAMVAKLREKPGGEGVPISIGSFASFSLQERFPLTGLQLPVSCGTSRPRWLLRDAGICPRVTRFDVHNQRVSVDSLGPHELSLETSVHEPFEQRTDSLHVVVRNGRVETYPVRLRYAYVSELDLMAQLAGLRLRERWADWDRTPFPSGKWMHVSVWERANDDFHP